MGRRKWVWKDEPPRFKPRKLASGKILYYYQAAGRQIPLGPDRDAALLEWAKLEAGGKTLRFREIAGLYRKTFDGFSKSTKQHYETALKGLEEAFEKFSLEQIEPKHIKLYMRRRSKKGAAAFEKRVLSALFNWARGDGLTSVANPCQGIQFSQAEKRAYEPLGKRRRYVSDAEFSEVYGRADEVLRAAMDLAVLTGQRPSDILKAKRQDIKEGVLWVTQQKTGTRVGIRVEGALEDVLKRQEVASIYIICDKRGQRVSYNSLNNRFRKARGESDWQFRDLRAKVASDHIDLKQAQQLLGHSSEAITASVYRRAKGAIVSPLKRNSGPD